MGQGVTSYDVRRYRRLKKAGVCVICKGAPARSGIVRCEPCQQKMLDKQRAKIAAGICYVCGGRIDGTSATKCTACCDFYEYKRALKRDEWVANGGCYRCGKPRADGNNLYCQRHREYNARGNRRYRLKIKREKMAALRLQRATCDICGGQKSADADRCKQCAGITTSALPVARAMVERVWSSRYELAQAASISLRGVYRAVERIERYGGVVDVRYEWNGKNSVAMLKLAKPPTWYRP